MAHTPKERGQDRRLRPAGPAPCDPQIDKQVQSGQSGRIGLPRLTDQANAERLARRHGQNLRYCHPWQKWLVWDGTCWRKDEDGEIYRRAVDTVRTIVREAAAKGLDGDQRKKIFEHALRSESRASLAAMVDLARHLEGIPIQTQALDAASWLLNASNGTVDLRTGALREHRRDDFITKCAPVSYDPAALCPKWAEFIRLTMGNDPELIRFIQIAVGYCLSGDTSERILFIPWGTGANGKSTFQITIHRMLGNDYCMKTPTSTLMNRRDTAIPNDIARLVGARLVYASESKEGCRLSEDTVKELTSGEPLTARFMRGEFFEFQPAFKLWLASNHKPVIKGTDEGIWDRVTLIPFTVRIPDVLPPSQQLTREAALAQFTSELSGILNWAIEGCLLYQREGLQKPGAVKDATASYREEMDTLADFIDECVTRVPGATTNADDLYRAYAAWARKSGEYQLPHKLFASRMADRGYTKTRRARGYVYENIRVSNPECTLMYPDAPKNAIDSSYPLAKAETSEIDTSRCTTIHSRVTESGEEALIL